MPLLPLLFLALLASAPATHLARPLPVATADRHALNGLELTEIGQFGRPRKPRPSIPAHLHSGVDIKRPVANHGRVPVFPIARGVVISRRDDGPYGQLIVAHQDADGRFWTVYEHIGGIVVSVGEEVQPAIPMARFFNPEELDLYGWQFDHLHFEVLRRPPRPLPPTPALPQRFYASHSLRCRDRQELLRFFHDPLLFLLHAPSGMPD